MAPIVVALDPAKLVNPNLDLRYLLPDEIVRRSAGCIQDDGYDYASTSDNDYDWGNPDTLLIYLTTDDIDIGLAIIVDVIQHMELLGNSLRDAATVAIADPDDGAPFRVIYPTQTPTFPGESLGETDA